MFKQVSINLFFLIQLYCNVKVCYSGYYGGICDSSCKHCLNGETGDKYKVICYHGWVPNYQQCESKRNEHNFTIIFFVINVSSKLQKWYIAYFSMSRRVLQWYLFCQMRSLYKKRIVWKTLWYLHQWLQSKLRTPSLSRYAVNESKDPLILLYLQTND